MARYESNPNIKWFTLPADVIYDIGLNETILFTVDHFFSLHRFASILKKTFESASPDTALLPLPLHSPETSQQICQLISCLKDSTLNDL